MFKNKLIFYSTISLVCAVALMVLSYVTIKQLAEKNREFITNSRENVPWAMYSLNSEINKMEVALYRNYYAQEIDQDELKLRFEVLLSRTVIIKSGYFKAFLDIHPTVKSKTLIIEQHVLDLAPYFSKSNLSKKDLMSIVNIIQKNNLAILSLEIGIESDQRDQERLIQIREEIGALNNRFVYFVILSFCFIMLLIFIQNRIITLQKQTMDELEKAKKVAQDVSDARLRFLAIMGHEIRTPLTSIYSTIELLKDANFNQEQRELYSTLSLCTQNMQKLLNDILDFSKSTSEKLSIEIIPFNFELICQEIESSYRLLCQKKNLEFYSQIAVQEVWIKSDPTRIRQIISNILSNSLKFTENGKISIQIFQANQFIHIIIKDTGIGLTHDQLKNIFKPFSQADVSITRRFGGTGLGMAIVKGIIETMGGNIHVESEINQGTGFYVSLPYSSLTPHEIPESNQNKLEDNLSQLKGLRILLAEDNLINQNLMKKMLEKRGFDVDVADNGEVVLTKLEQHEYDLILMDMQMPILDGPRCTEKIRALNAPYSKMPIVALSADAAQDLQDEYIKSGLDGYLTKPLDWEKFVSVISKLSLAPKKGQAKIS